MTLVSPSDGFFTNTGTATLSAEVVDAEAGVLETDIRIVIDTESEGVIGLGTVQKSPIVDGYRVTMIPTGTIGEGPKKWFVGVEDKVGNVPAMDIPDTGKTDATRTVRTADRHGACGCERSAEGRGGDGGLYSGQPLQVYRRHRVPHADQWKDGPQLEEPRGNLWGSCRQGVREYKQERLGAGLL